MGFVLSVQKNISGISVDQYERLFCNSSSRYFCTGVIVARSGSTQTFCSSV